MYQLLSDLIGHSYSQLNPLQSHGKIPWKPRCVLGIAPGLTGATPTFDNQETVGSFSPFFLGEDMYRFLMISARIKCICMEDTLQITDFVVVILKPWPPFNPPLRLLRRLKLGHYQVPSQSFRCSYSYMLLQGTILKNIYHHLVWRHLASGVMIDSSKVIIILVVILNHWKHFFFGYNKSLASKLELENNRKSIMQPENEDFL